MAIQALCDNDGLWQKYLEDFTHQKLHLEYERDALQRLAILHVYVHIHKLNLAKVVSILRPLDKIEVAVSVFPSLSETVHCPAQSFLHDVEDSGDFLGRPEALSVFVIDTLFGAIAGIGMSCSEPSEKAAGESGEGAVEQLRLWFNVYSGVVSHLLQQQPKFCFKVNFHRFVLVFSPKHFGEAYEY